MGRILIQEDHFDVAKQLIRIAHTINFSWSLLGDAVVTSKYIEREDTI
jgi:hypothetical protein